MFGSGTGGQGFTFGTPTTTQSTGAGGMFGTPATGSASTGFNFGAAAPQTTPATTGGLALGNPATAAGATQGFSFATAPAPTASAGGFNLGGALGTPAAPAATGGFSFGGSSTATAAPTTASTQPAGGFSTQPAGGFSFGQTTGFSLGTPATTSTATVGLGLGTTPASGSAGGFSLGGTSTSTTNSNALLTGLLSTPKTAAAPTAAPTATPTAAPTGLGSGFSLGTTPQVSAGATGLKLGVTPATTTASTGISFGGLKTGLSATTTAATTLSGLGFGVQPTATTTTAASSVGFGIAATATTASPGFALKIPTSTAMAAPTTTTAQPSTQMNYRQLEEQINKWMAELEEQERLFLQQATQVNAWDRLLVDNGEKITQLNGDMERVKVDQNKLEQELEFIKSQQTELQELLVPMEKALELMPSSSLQPHADLERENTYQLADNIDAQLKRMVQDLKEIIDHLNTSTSNQDTNDPILQITKILNAHMDSLQWIDSNTALLSSKVEDISNKMENQRKDQERNFRLVYD